METTNVEIDARRALTLAGAALEHAAGLAEPPEPGSQLEADLAAYNAVNDALQMIERHRNPGGTRRGSDACGFTWFTGDGLVHCCGQPAATPHVHACGAMDECPVELETAPPGTLHAMRKLREADDEFKARGGEVPHELYSAVLNVLAVFDAEGGNHAGDAQDPPATS